MITNEYGERVENQRIPGATELPCGCIFAKGEQFVRCAEHERSRKVLIDLIDDNLAAQILAGAGR